MMKHDTQLILDDKMQVNVIPATKRHIQNGNQLRSQANLRVAAYCRVSTEEESQENSYAAQKNHYTMLILSRPGWELAGIYADGGKSGTSRKRRVRFNQMLEDARNGKIDYIITKSISRFARNTADALECIHELQRHRPPVGVYFERENIDTLNANSEMFLTIYCSMAQEESHSISENIKWSIQKNFRAGKPQINLRRMLGYDQCRDGSWEINEEQADTVRYIYRRFLKGISANAIARELNEAGRGTVNGGIWRADTVFNILRNEKYVGDLRMQKTYTESFLTHKSVVNNGEYPQYFLKDHHPAIVERAMWNQVQELLSKKQIREKRKLKKVRTSIGEIEIGLDSKNETGIHQSLNSKRKCGPPVSLFADLVCGECGSSMRRMTYSSTIRGYKNEKIHEREPLPENTEFRDVYVFSYAVWKCPHSPGRKGALQGERSCKGVTLTEISMEQAFMEMLYRIKRDYQYNGDDSEIVRSFRAAYNAVLKREINSGFIEQKLQLLDMEIAKMDSTYCKILQKLELENYAAGIIIGGNGGIRTAMNNNYIRMADDLKKRLMEKEKERRMLLAERGVAPNMKENFEAFIKALIALPDTNETGMKLNINALDVDGSIFRTSGGQNRGCLKRLYSKGKLHITEEILATAPDYLDFSHYIMHKFILKMEAYGDTIQYGTTFGLVLTTIGNSRPIRAFMGYRKSDGDGNMELIVDSHQIARGKIQHQRRKVKDFKKIGNSVE